MSSAQTSQMADEPAGALLGASRHALRGVSASLAVGALLSSLSANRRALLSLKFSQLTLARPSRNVVAIAVFVGVFRLIDRCKRGQHPQKPTKKENETHSPMDKTAPVTAAVLGLACLPPDSRPPLISLVATHAASSWFQTFIADHPQLAALKPLDLVVFLASNGWIFLSGFFHPESYEPSHLKLIKKYSLTREHVATYLQSQFKHGLNPTSCDVRHPGRACHEFAVRTFLPLAIKMALRIYAPVHVMTWLLALVRHKRNRNKPLKDHVRQLTKRMVQSALYYVGFVFVGWTMACYTDALGANSLAWRKFQFWLCGSLPSISILCEGASRRRTIAVILSSYSFLNMGAVLAQQNGFQWLQRGRGPARTVLQVAVVAFAVASTFGELLEGSVVAQRMLLGETMTPRVRDNHKGGTIKKEDVPKSHGDVAM